MNKPSKTQVGGDHYKDMPIQPHYFCHVNKLGALESNVVKYVCRHSRKGGKADLLKARHYIDLLLEWQYDDDGQTSPADGPRRFPDADALSAARRMASAGDPLITALPPGWPYAQSGTLDADLVGELTEHEVRQGLRPDHSSQATCIAHGLTICKPCEQLERSIRAQFPAGTS